HDPHAYLDALTRLPLHRAAAGTVGGTAHRLGADGLLFDQEGPEHRRLRRALHDGLGPAGVAKLRPVWTAVLRRRLAPLAAGEPVDLVPVAAELAGVTAAALLGVDADPTALAAAARRAAATAGSTVPSVIGPPPCTPGTTTVSAAATSSSPWSGSTWKPAVLRTGWPPAVQVLTA
ncbi:hypothetical protein QLR68_13960, partial [Micromonospora sp. DH15]|nr:hypothetical protein [Micromonospora sp. DH15]